MITQTQPRDQAVPLSDGSALSGLLRGYRVPLGLTILVLVGALLGPSALTSGSSGEAAAGVQLDVGWGYIMLAPITNILDTLSVLTLPQHYAVLITMIAAFVMWRALRARRVGRPLGVERSLGRRVGAELGVATLSFLGLAGFYGFGMVGHRPMAAVAPTDDDVVVIDVHSHTEHSHDSRPGFTAQDRREWHAAAGFDAVYVSDHRTWQGYDDAAPANPARAGMGTVLLPAIEIEFDGKYASVLGEERRYRSAVEKNDLRRDVVERMYRDTGVRPTLVMTIPEGLDNVVPWTPDTVGFVALELSDASPRGLRQSRRDRARLLRMADSLDLALVAATNNHGWGRTAAAWTLMRIPGWQRLSPAQLGDAIERTLHQERRNAAWVVERRVPWAGDDPVALANTVPAITWNMFGGISAAERVAWLTWIWLIAILAPLALGARQDSGDHQRLDAGERSNGPGRSGTRKGSGRLPAPSLGPALTSYSAPRQPLRSASSTSNS